MADLLQKYRLLKGLCTGHRACTGPFFVTLDVTRRCNLRCLGCRFHSGDGPGSGVGDPDVKDVSVEMAERLCSDLEELNTRALFLIGEGEPFLHPHIFDVIRLAKKHGMRTTVTTNGTLIDERTARGIIDTGLDEIHVSLWTHSPEGYARHYPGTDPVNFDRVLEGVRTLSSLKGEDRTRAPRLLLTHPINRLNYRGADNMVALAKRTGFDAISFTPFKTNRGNLSRYALSRREQTDLCEHMKRLRKQIRTQDLEENIGRLLARYEFNAAEHRSPCYISWYHSRIKVDGTVLACGRSERVLGNLNRERFPEIWNGKAYRLDRSKRLSPGGLAYRNTICDCEYCAFVQDNMAIHRWFRYLLPFHLRFREDAEPSPHNRDPV